MLHIKYLRVLFFVVSVAVKSTISQPTSTPYVVVTALHRNIFITLPHVSRSVLSTLLVRSEPDIDASTCSPLQKYPRIRTVYIPTTR